MEINGICKRAGGALCWLWLVAFGGVMVVPRSEPPHPSRGGCGGFSMPARTSSQIAHTSGRADLAATSDSRCECVYFLCELVRLVVYFLCAMVRGWRAVASPAFANCLIPALPALEATWLS